MQAMDYTAILLGFVTTFVVPIVSQSKFSAKTRQLIAMALSITAGFISVAISGQWTPDNVAASIMLAIAGSQTFYMSLDKTGVFGAIESATDINKVNDSKEAK